ncbi:hypothetical protein PROFUN_14364 [Planoprotostelium fungivorum]|uniref:Clathrin/coatomer adaptor adaptin-like N-terminal domain-containing protein n=1 Tax=Planoprotostelium fungivorum TaxID=1890364 RepID=A0A2P6N0E1_9EUKA|nr:hypothetical protein PROFUN_14364 [Planoprotostelium fungivorum]
MKFTTEHFTWHPANAMVVREAIGVSRSFVDFISKIGDARSKQEEDQVVSQEVENMRTEMNHLEGQSAVNQKEFLVKLIYCEMLGHSASFGCIHAIKMTQQPDLLTKRTGYLLFSMITRDDDEMLLLIVSSVLRDLKSRDYISNWCGLTFLSQTVNRDIIPAVIKDVLALSKHERSIIRKKVVSVLHKFWRCDPKCVEDIESIFRLSLCDKDPSVMAASLPVFLDILQRDPKSQKELAPTFVSILKQVGADRALPPVTFNHHNVPSPWVQLYLLNILSIVGRDDPNTSSHMYRVISEIIHSASQIKNNVAYAIIFECVRTICIIHPNDGLLDVAAKAVYGFLSSKSRNLVYMGLSSLHSIISLRPEAVNEYQDVIVRCLEDSDPIIKHRTVDLLCSMVNPVNLQFILDTLIQHMKEMSLDGSMIAELMPKVSHLIVKASMVPAQVIQMLWDAIEEEGTHPDIITLSIWVNSESQPNEVVRTMDLIDRICQLSHRETMDESMGRQIVNALIKLSLHCEESREKILQRMHEMSASRSHVMSQMATEAVWVLNTDVVVDRQRFTNNFDGKFEMDVHMKFLEHFVEKCATETGLSYVPPERRAALRTSQEMSNPSAMPIKRLRFEEYDTPKTMSPSIVGRHSLHRSQSIPNEENQNDAMIKPERAEENLIQGKSVWGPDGYTPQSEESPKSDVLPALLSGIPNLSSPAKTKPSTSFDEKKKNDTKHALFGISSQIHRYPETKKEVHSNRSREKKEEKKDNDANLLDLEPTDNRPMEPTLSPTDAHSHWTKLMDDKKRFESIGDLVVVPSIERVSGLLGTSTDLTLTVATTKMYQNDGVILVLFVLNLSDKDILSDVQLSWDVSNHLKLQTESAEPTAQWRELPPNRCVPIFHRLSMEKFSSHANIRLNISYRLNGTGQPRNLTSNTPAFTHDFIRPIKMTQETFEGLWNQLNIEKKLSVPDSYQKMEDIACENVKTSSIRLKLSALLHLSSVGGAPTVENGSMAGKTLDASLCLCRFVREERSLEMTLRTRDAALGQSFINDMMRLIQKK